MSNQRTSLAGFLDELATDPIGRERWNETPLAAVAAAGVRLTGDELRAWLGLSGASDHELVEVVRAKIVRGYLDDGDAGCGCSCVYPDTPEPI